MAEYLIYVNFPKYLAQWYANQCREHEKAEEPIFRTEIYRFDRYHIEAVKPIKGSLESLHLRDHLQKPQNYNVIGIPEDTTLAIEIPYYKEKDPRVYHYLDAKFIKMLEDIIRKNFAYEFGMYMQQYLGKNFRKDKLIENYMALHGMDYLDETCVLAVQKVYQRQRKIYYQHKTKRNGNKISRDN